MNWGKNTYLSRNWIILLTIGFILIVVAQISIKSKVDNLECRIETTNNYFRKLVIQDSTLIRDIKLTQFKEDSYLRQLNRDTNLIFWFVAVIVGLFGLLSYASFNKRVQMLEDDLTERVGSSIGELNQLKQELEDVKADINAESSVINQQVAESCLRDGDNDLFVFYLLVSIYGRANYYLRFKKVQDLNTSTLKTIKSTTAYLHIKLVSFENKPKVEKQFYLNVCSVIQEINDFEIIDVMAKIHSLIEFED